MRERDLRALLERCCRCGHARANHLQGLPCRALVASPLPIGGTCDCRTFTAPPCGRCSPLDTAREQQSAEVKAAQERTDAIVRRLKMIAELRLQSSNGANAHRGRGQRRIEAAVIADLAVIIAHEFGTPQKPGAGE